VLVAIVLRLLFSGCHRYPNFVPVPAVFFPRFAWLTFSLSKRKFTTPASFVSLLHQLPG
jgi:hypothetical protein